jgi:CO dehydrogenase nickel-insertion accessory protein CooC1
VRGYKLAKKYQRKSSKNKIVKKIAIESIYKIINKAQLGKKTFNFAVESELAPVIDNILKDAEVEHEKIELKTKIKYNLYPSKNINESEFLDIEDFSDELFKDAQGQ